MKNIKNICSTRRQKLLESKNQREFEKETEELDVWISEQMSQATSDEYGEDYEHVLVRCNFLTNTKKKYIFIKNSID